MLLHQLKSNVLVFTFIVILFLGGQVKSEVILALDQTNQLIQTSLTEQTTAQVMVNAQGGFPVDIPDNDPNGVVIEIDTTGLFSGTLTRVTIELGIEHSYIGDLSATLTSPEGVAQLVMFSRVGLTTDNAGNGLGFRSNLNGTYLFDDQYMGNLWTSAAENLDGTVPAGLYRTSTGGTGLSDIGGCTTRLNGAFGGLTPEQSNGVWTLTISDNDVGAVGQVFSAAIMADTALDDRIFQSSFEVRQFVPLGALPASDVLNSCKKAQFDLSGNGLSDYVTSWENDFEKLVVQNDTNYGLFVPTTSELIFTELPFDSTTVTSGGDFDGDGITDLVFATASKNPDFPIAYLIRRSSRPNDSWISVLAAPGITDFQFGDYDDDGLDDLGFAFEADGQVGFFAIRSSDLGNPLQFLIGPGPKSNYRMAGGFDHNGDGHADILAMINDQLGNSDQIGTVFSGIDGSFIIGTNTARWNSRVRQLPGTFLSTGTAGIGTFVVDVPGDDAFVFEVDLDTNSSFSLDRAMFLGVDPTDTPLTGDYDGDGIDDFGVWRPNTDAKGIRFIISPSTDPLILLQVSPKNPVSTDQPLAASRVR